MNIFVLDPDPQIAASLHCDQHLHKMILESAQMLSAAVRHYLPDWDYWDAYYKPTHQNHPCTQWVCQSKHNAAWLCQLCYALDNIRLDQGAQDSHASLRIIDLFSLDVFGPLNVDMNPDPFIFAGPASISCDSRLSVPQKYQALYRLKAEEWARDGKARMSFKGRKVPEFLRDLV